MGGALVVGWRRPGLALVHLDVPASEEATGHRVRRDDLEVITAARLALVNEEHLAPALIRPGEDRAALELGDVEQAGVEALGVGVGLELTEDAVHDRVGS